MRPIKFKEANVIFAKDQKEYQPLPALRIDSTQGEVISCWKFSLWERLQILIFGKLWVCNLTFKKSLQPMFFSVKKNEMFTTKKQ